MAMLKSWQEIPESGRPTGGSIVEDLRDFVENVSAVDRPALSILRKSRVRTQFVEWLEDTLAARGHNAMDEGQAATQPNLTTPSRTVAHVQTFAAWGQVSDLQRAVEHAGMEDMELYQENKAVKQVLNDIEHAIHCGSAATGNTDANRQMAGFLNCISTNATNVSGITCTEDVFGDLIQLFVDGGTEVRPSIGFVNSYLKRTISQYSTKVTRNIEAAARQQTLVIERYSSDFGDIDMYFSRDQLKGTSKTGDLNSLTLIDPQYFELGWLQSLMSEQLARDGLRTQFQVSAMLTLVYRTEKGGMAAQDLSSYLPPAT